MDGGGGRGEDGDVDEVMDAANERITDLAIQLKSSQAALPELMRLTAALRAAARRRYGRSEESEDASIVWEAAQDFDARACVPFTSWLWRRYKWGAGYERRRIRVHSKWESSLLYHIESDAYHADPEHLLIRAQERGSARRRTQELLGGLDSVTRYLIERVIIERDATIAEACEEVGVGLADGAEALRVGLGEMVATARRP